VISTVDLPIKAQVTKLSCTDLKAGYRNLTVTQLITILRFVGRE